jgi:uncharacterized repeat protein (TIGR01451 family)
LALLGLFLACSGDVPEARASFPGTNGLIAFASDRDFNLDINVMTETGAARRQLTREGDNIDPDWSPDGRKIAFSALRYPQTKYGIYVMNSDGSRQRRLTSDDDFRPAWSPDGSRLAFVRNRAGNLDIWIMHPDGSAQEQLTHEPSAESAPEWSPAGSRLAFHSDRAGTRDVYVMGRDGSEQKRLTTAGSDDAVPSWSPDGSRIAFASDRDGDYEIFVISAEGTGQRQLTANDAVDWNPSWSPDGRRIVFQRVSAPTSEGNDLWVMQADGSRQRRLSGSDPTENASPDWQPGIDLVVRQRTEPSRLRQGEALTYRLVVQNRSPLTATDLRLRDDLPERVRLLSVRSSGGKCAGQRPIRCRLVGLPGNRPFVVTVRVRPLRAGILVNQALVWANERDSAPASNRSILRMRVVTRRP